MADESIQSLTALGLTALEAEIYRFLLQQSPATGYRIAQGLGKPAANVYKALQSLHEKTAVLSDGGDPRRFRPVSVEELLDRLQRRFERQRQRAHESLARLPGPSDDQGIYQLRGPDAVFDRCHDMLRSAQSEVLVDAFPIPLASLADDLRICAGRGIRVVAKAYQSTRVEGVDVVVPPHPERLLERWPVQWLNLVVDGNELLIAVFDAEGERVRHATWTRNPWLSFILEGTLAHEIAFSAVRAASLETRANEQILDAIVFGEGLLAHRTTGESRLRSRLGLGERPSSAPSQSRESS